MSLQHITHALILMHSYMSEKNPEGVFVRYRCTWQGPCCDCLAFCLSLIALCLGRYLSNQYIVSGGVSMVPEASLLGGYKFGTGTAVQTGRVKRET